MSGYQSFYTVDSKYIPILLIYVAILIPSIIIAVIWYKKYKSIPDKTVTATLIKTTDYSGYGSTNDNLAPQERYTVAKYEYYINGKRHTVIIKCFGEIQKQITLYYKKGVNDIRNKKVFSLPFPKKLLLLLYFVVGIAVITYGIATLLGYKVI